MKINKYENLLYKSNEIDIRFKYLYNYNKEYLNFLLAIETEKFVGKQEFYLNTDYVRQLIRKINEIYKLKNGEILIDDSNSESSILISMNGYELVELRGKIGNAFDCICMTFNVNIDQTVLELLKDILAETINLVENE